MNTTSIMQRNADSIRGDATTYLFAVGQAVHLKSKDGRISRRADIYRITGKLPPAGESPQYRIRSDNEYHDRVTTQDRLEPARITASGDSATLIERTFGHR